MNSIEHSKHQQQAASGAKSPTLAVVLGSSGTRAFAALPFLQRLDQEGLQADLVIGSGGGGLMAALWSAGYNLVQIEKFFTQHFTRDAYENPEDISGLLSGRASEEDEHFQGLYSPKSLRLAYQTIFKAMRLEELPTRTILYATDILSGEGVCLERGEIATAVEACGAYYPIMPPVACGEMLLADGSFVSPLPVMEAVKRGADLILAIYLEETAPFHPRSYLESTIAVSRVISKSLRRAQLISAIDMHDYEICIAEVPYAKPVMPWDVEHIPGILMQGKLAAQLKIPELLRQYDDFSQRKVGGEFVFHGRGRTQQGGEAATGASDRQAPPPGPDDAPAE